MKAFWVNQKQTALHLIKVALIDDSIKMEPSFQHGSSPSLTGTFVMYIV